MFRGLLGFGKDDRPQPPKGKIEVVCPTCGAFQYEPRMVFSTFCKKCGDHLRIENKRVIGSGERTDYAAAESVEPAALVAEKEVVKNAPTLATPPPESKLEKSVEKTAEPKPSPSSKYPSIIPGPVVAGVAGKKEESAAQEDKSEKPAAKALETDESGFGAMIQRSVADKAPVAVPTSSSLSKDKVLACKSQSGSLLGPGIRRQVV